VRAIGVFIAIAYALSIALSLVFGLTGGAGGPLAWLRWLSMFLPAVAVAIVTATMNEPPRGRVDRLPLAWLPVALFLIPVVLHAAMLPAMYALEGPPQWQTPPAWGPMTGSALAGRIAVNAIVGLAIASFLSFFEEIGWRAWLLPRLAERMDARRAVVATAIVWALWHVPFQLSGIQHVDGVSPIRLALSLPLGIATAGLILGWLWLRTESVWIVSLAHGSLNAWGQFAFRFMKDTPPEQVGRDLLVLNAGFAALLVVSILLLSPAAASRPRPAATPLPGIRTPRRPE